MRFLSADYIIPVNREPLARGVLVMDDQGEIIDLLDAGEVQSPIEGLEQFKGILCPGFLNTHCHLELSWAKGLIPEKAGLNAFLNSLDNLRKNLDEQLVSEAIALWGDKMFEEGIVAAGDIVNSLSSLDYKRSSQITFHTFAEIFASDPENANLAFERINALAAAYRASREGARVSVTPHSTYSLSFKLFRLLGEQSDPPPGILSIHHQENRDENDYFRDGWGPIALRRTRYNPGIEPFQFTGQRPLESIAHFFDRDRKIQLVHNTVTEAEDIDFAMDYFRNLTWCLCPNANLYIENRLPDVELFRKKGCKLSLGTDSLASNHQLSILDEMKTLSAHDPFIPLGELITWATRNGAEFLGFDHLGTFDKGKSPGVVLIENIDIENFSLLKNSHSRLLIQPGLL